NQSGETVDTADIDELTKLIAREADADADADVKMNKGSAARTTRQLENRFRDCCRFMLHEVVS
ncbi:MAG: hypothetical protein WBG95_04855, partial [Sulfitobacter sp.]